MANLWRDLRTGIYALLNAPSTTAVSLLTLALGIGANTAIFSLLNAVVLRPLPVPHPEQLVVLATAIADSVNEDQPVTVPMFSELSRRQKGFSELFAWYSSGVNNFEAEGRHVTAALATVSGDYYKAMRITPILGRFIVRSDVALDSGTSNAVAVISYRAWREWYHGSSRILGQTVRIENQPFTIIGVEPEGYSGLIIDGSTDVTVPLFATGREGPRNPRDPRVLWLRVYGRLQSGMALPQMQARLQTLWPHILEATRPPGYEGERRSRFFARRIRLDSAATGISSLRQLFSPWLWVLLGLVGSVLLIACLNLANLALARAAARQHEAGVRAALGAGVWDLVRLPLIESFLLSLSGALLGLIVAYGMSRILLQIAWTGLAPSSLSISPDKRVLAFTVTVTAITGLLFGVVPAWYAARTDPKEALSQQTRSVRRGSTVLGKALLIVQMALSLVLVAGALLFGQTLTRLHTVDVGYRRDHLLTMLLFPQAENGQRQIPAAYYRDLATQLKSLPGVESVSFSCLGPANESEDFEPVYSSLKQAAVQAVYDIVGPDFFQVAGMRLLRGRGFIWNDDEHGPKVVILSQSLAEKLFGQQEAVGRTVYLGPLAHAQPRVVIGVVNSASLWKVGSFHPMAIYQPLAMGFVDMNPIVDLRTTVDPHAMAASAEQAVRSLRRHYSLRTVTAEERLDSYLTAQRLTALLSAFFGSIAILIASVGVYGLMSFHVTQRTAELGIRVALGAQRRQVWALVLQEVLLWAGLGSVLGLIMSLAGRKLVTGLLFCVSPSDPVILGLSVLTLIAVAIVAGFMPGWRAAGVDPITALRAD
jgi:predicted permease